MKRETTTIIFDLDDTLMVEMASEEAAFLAACGPARERHGVDPERLYKAVRARAGELWQAFEAHPFCRRIGFASWEGLWSSFEGGAPEMKLLREWGPTYHHEAWSRALADVGVEDEAFVVELSERYKQERIKRHVNFEETEAVLEDLRKDFRLGMLTNGAEDIQQKKIAGSGLAPFFDAIVITGAIGIGKPAPRAFDVILNQLGVTAAETVMVGNSLSSDVRGAINAGLSSVWLNRDGSWAEEGITPDIEIANLIELRTALDQRK